MYSVRAFKKGLQNPSLVLRESKRIVGKRRNSKVGVDFFDRDWDNLILLDACRYDLFREENLIEGDLTSVRSNASSSPEFFEKNVEGREFGDTVYYSANPHIDKYNSKFYNLCRLWEVEWDEDTGTVLPSNAVDRVLQEKDQYKDKRIVVHMMQPHRPFLGPESSDFEQAGFSAKGVNIDKDEEPEVPFWWTRLERDELSKEKVWKMYKETLQVALPHVKRLVDELSGKSVISADHGNVFGESGLYGHPSYRSHEKLITVPWLEIDKPRKGIVDDKATAHTKREHYHEAEDQLAALGYLNK